MFKCNLCERSFETQRGLNRHYTFCQSRHNSQLSPQDETTVNEDQSISIIDNLVRDVPDFIWGEMSADIFIRDLNFIYEKTVYWKKNIFKLPSGSTGKKFIRECTRLIKSWTSKSALRDIAWKCIMVMPHILLQKPSKDSKSKDHSNALKRRLDFWHEGKIMEIYHESNTIQQRLKTASPPNSTEAISKKFANLMKKGNVSGAVKLLTDNMTGGILPLNDETMILLRSKHPEPKVL